MSDLISRDAALEVINGIDSYFAKYIDAIPAADVVEVVRCKDCKHLFEDNGCPLRTWWTHLENDFCSYAERRTDD